MVEYLGGNITQNAIDCTHLVCDSVARTVKFMAAINVCQYVLSTEWIKASHKANKFLKESDYILHDDRTENEYGFSLEKTMEKRKTMKKKDFRRVTILHYTKYQTYTKRLGLYNYHWRWNGCEFTE